MKIDFLEQYYTHSYNIVIFIRDIFFLYMSFGKFSYYNSHHFATMVRENEVVSQAKVRDCLKQSWLAALVCVVIGIFIYFKTFS